ncbi:DUF2778 domain-containing protein [Ensifer sp. MJa1]|uniref:DUF2778 domain-containing protein n=1 Tax=Ensifer sp. MJa1 TaxID=2919888 RepID=UPI00300844E7
MGSSAHGSGLLLPKPQLHLADRVKDRAWEKHARVSQASKLIAATAKPVELASLAPVYAKTARSVEVAGNAVPSAKTEHIEAGVTKTLLAPQTLAGNAERSTPAVTHGLSAKIEMPAPERFGPLPAVSADKPATVLAYATPAQSGATGAAFSAVMTAPDEDEVAVSPDPDVDADDDTAALPDYEDTPSAGPLPQSRPAGEQAKKPVAGETEKPNLGQPQEAAATKDGETQKPAEREVPKQQKLAYARPDPTENSSGTGFGQALRNVFGGGAKAGNGVAVYDITAAKVYMPDGSVLEAHSGIGKMADNPRYVNVKMTGPTPPHTYNLRMRETRFHGVEAIRMLPVDGKNKHGRDGFLTHSYLLRGKRAESHGCVAFADYPRFLTAFKQGKVKQIVVVPSGGRAAGLRLASNGRNS